MTDEYPLGERVRYSAPGFRSFVGNIVGHDEDHYLVKEFHAGEFKAIYRVPMSACHRVRLEWVEY